MRRYRRDLFFRTEANIIALHIGYVLFILLASLGALSFLTTHPGHVAEFVIAIFAITALFGYLAARVALEPARRALSAQKEFIGNIAHELRTPLSIIKTNTEVRLLDPNLTADARTLGTSTIEELDRISDIIHNLLSLNALVQPEHVSFEDVDMSKIAHRVANRLSRLAQSKHIDITFDIGQTRTAWANTSAVEQIITNLVRNALAHADSGTIVIAIGQDHRDFLSLTVTDSGKGIAREDLYRIFEPFYQGDRARTRTESGGSGLGLTIVSELVKLQHGRVSIQSAPNHGTTVTVQLPIGRKQVRHILQHERTTRKSSGAPLHEVALDFSRHPDKGRAW